MKTKKKLACIYVALILAVCLIPFVGMTKFRTDETTENKTLASFPSLMTDGQVNLAFFDELSEYFEDHFAFREILVNVDAEIQSRIFQVSNVDTVIAGENGWLYYSATLDDYLGQNLLSERAIYATAHNLSLIQTCVEEQGAKFAVTVAPNKNSLYGENMPYYDSYVVSEEKNADHLQAALAEEGVTYVDLFSLFKEQDEILYLKRDSHWNNKGAVLVYNELLSVLDVSHDVFETVRAVRTKTEIGDLNSMIYPLTSEPEWNYSYEYETKYSYVTDTESVEDSWIETENSQGEGSLLMFRDSFGNTLLPLMANTFSSAYFSKEEPYGLSQYMEAYSPEVVIVEKAERNISDFAETPPVMEDIKTEITGEIAETPDETTCEVGESEVDTSYLSVNGTLDESAAGTETQVYIVLSQGEAQTVYEAFLVISEESEYGYQLYISLDSLAEICGESSGEIELSVLTEQDGSLSRVHTETVNMDPYLSEEE
ncbi:MAG: hypothetical protein LUE63_04935 [Lachnospiraceae bacterium]|nr:hypothetical protein [Lachnospiraceae bacterium]